MAAADITSVAEVARAGAAGVERIRDRWIFRRENQEAEWRVHSLSQKTQEEEQICGEDELGFRLIEWTVPTEMLSEQLEKRSGEIWAGNIDSAVHKYNLTGNFDNH